MQFTKTTISDLLSNALRITQRGSKCCENLFIGYVILRRFFICIRRNLCCINQSTLANKVRDYWSIREDPVCRVPRTQTKPLCNFRSKLRKSEKNTVIHILTRSVEVNLIQIDHFYWGAIKVLDDTAWFINNLLLLNSKNICVLRD